MPKKIINFLKLNNIRIRKYENHNWITYLSNLNVEIEQNNILGILDINSGSNEKIFELLTAFDIKPDFYQGNINIRYDDEQTFLIKKNETYAKNISYAFDENFDSNVKKSIYNYLKQYFIDSNLLKVSVNNFVNSWAKTYANYSIYLQKVYTDILLNFERNSNKKLLELSEKVSDINQKVNSGNNFYLYLLEIKKQLIDLFTILRNSQYDLMQTSYETINKYEHGNSYLDYSKFSEIKSKYEEALRKYQNKLDYKLYLKKQNSLEIRNYLNQFSKLNFENIEIFKKIYIDLYNENLYLKDQIKIYKNDLDSYIYFYWNYILNQRIIKFIDTNFEKLKWIKKDMFSAIWQDVYNLRNIAYFETSYINFDDPIYIVNNKIKKIVFENFEIKKNYYIDKINRNYKEYISNLLKLKKNKFNTNETEIYTSNYISLEKLNEIKTEYISIKNDYMWNYENTFIRLNDRIRENLNDLKKINSNNRSLFKNIKSMLSSIYSKINRFNDSDEKNNSNIIALINELKDLKKNYIVEKNNFYTYRNLFRDAKVSPHIYTNYMLNSLIYTILKKANISFSDINNDINSLTLSQKIQIEKQKLLINKPSLIIIGRNITKLDEKLQAKLLDQINKYIFEQKIIGIYLLNNINIASKLTTDICIINQGTVIEQGKTQQVVTNPINPITKSMLGYVDSDTNEKISRYNELKSNKFENILPFEVDNEHTIWCSKNQLYDWATIKNIKTDALKKSIFSDVDKIKNKTTKINDCENFDETQLFNYVELNDDGEQEMDKNYNHIIVEQGRYQKWLDANFFSEHQEKKLPFTIIMPPPNVTGNLHIGHALDTYLMDSIIRFKKLQGYDVLFLPGKDHAGIATQAKVEKKLLEQNITKYDLGREKFIEKIWEWKDDYSNNITKQWQKLGLFIDYNFERFTLDKQANEAVLVVFVKLYNDGLIYRSNKPINWDPKLKTALSNIEVIPKSTEQKLYYIKYPLEDSSAYLLIATTRPETMFSDVAIAINQEDERAEKLLNQTVIHPLTKRRIKIITSPLIDKNFGTGLMKVSAHAMDDIDIIKQNNLEIIECIDDNGLLNEKANEFAGLDRFEARKKIIEFLQERNLIEKIEDITSNVGYSERSQVPIEILVRPQWFVKMDKLAEKLLLHFNNEDKVNFFPERFADVLKKWMENVNDWTISRQIWWGHRIPAWYKGNKILVQINCPGEGWKQDSDVLDTWFSSALSPFVFLGWPQTKKYLNRYFPTDLLVTGYDIIFFWVARMYFQSLYFMNEKPFKNVLIHGLVRDEQGRKMSKSLGNGINPIEIIDKYGSDVLRMSLIFNSSPGQDINFSEEKIQGARLFINKFWNIARLVSQIKYKNILDYNLTNLDEYDYWILDKFLILKRAITKDIDKYEFSLIFKSIQNFIINDFSSWYLEFLKLKNNNNFIHVLFRELLILLHPFMPFTTDYLFEYIYSEELLDNEFHIFSELNVETNNVNRLIEIISTLRKYREDKKISKSETLHYWIKNIELSENQKEIVEKMTNFKWTKNTDFSIKLSKCELFIKQSKETKAQEQEEFKKIIGQLKIDIEFNEKLLNNPKFIEKANPNLIEEKNKKLALLKEKLSFYQSKIQIKTSKK